MLMVGAEQRKNGPVRLREVTAGRPFEDTAQSELNNLGRSELTVTADAQTIGAKGLLYNTLLT